MKQVLLSEDEHNDMLEALQQTEEVYGFKAAELEKSIILAEKKVQELREGQETINSLRTKVTLAENVTIEFEMGDDETPEPDPEIVNETHTICMCLSCQHKRQSIITDASIEQLE